MKENQRGIMATAGPAPKVEMAIHTPSELVANWERSIGPPHLPKRDMLGLAYQFRRKA